MKRLTKAFFKAELLKATPERLTLQHAQLLNEFPGYAVEILKAMTEVLADSVTL